MGGGRARTAGLVASAFALVLGMSVTPAAARESRRTPTTALVYTLPVDDYGSYQPQRACRPNPKPGILMLADLLVSRGGGYGTIGRSCRGGGLSEHKESRAFDWLLDATSAEDKALAKAFLDEAFATDAAGESHALARRMGIMYVIWNDTMWASYDAFAKKRYLSSGCRNRRSCSPTLRHRDHMHISLTRKGARGTTSWYLSQPAA